MNTAILPNDGEYSLKTISLEEAQRWVSSKDFISAIGHSSTAEIMSALLGVTIEPNRVMVSFDKGDEALVFKLETRLPEGKILTINEIQNLPFSWKILKRVN